jgi:S-adenosyl methyltransferase
MGQSDWVPPEVDTKRANVARVYDYWLGGDHNFLADQDVAPGGPGGWCRRERWWLPAMMTGCCGHKKSLQPWACRKDHVPSDRRAPHAPGRCH